MSERPTWNGRVHPVAALAPMLADDDLDDLAADIEENGLNHPIVLDAEGTLIDGRNRLAACERAGVEPRFATINGSDPARYIVSENIKRRHLTQGQRAMWEVLADPDKFVRDRRSSLGKLAADLDVDRLRLGDAVVVYQYARQYAEAIVGGSYRLDEAAAEARRRREDEANAEQRAERSRSDLAVLLKEAPDLGKLVADNRLDTADAMAALRRRRQDAYDANVRVTRLLWSNLCGLWSSLVPPPERILAQWIGGERGMRDTDAYDALLTGEGLRDLAGRIGALADAVEANGGLDG